MSDLHTHQCDVCREPVPCEGPLEYNPDGDPVVWCLVVHEQQLRVLCADCVELVEDDD